MILGDFNIHVDDVTNSSASKLSDILANHSLLQHVKSPTHSDGHILDLLITRNDHPVVMLPTDPPLLSHHAFVVADCVCPPLPDASSGCRSVRNWRSFDIESFLSPQINRRLISSSHRLKVFVHVLRFYAAIVAGQTRPTRAETYQNSLISSLVRHGMP